MSLPSFWAVHTLSGALGPSIASMGVEVVGFLGLGAMGAGMVTVEKITFLLLCTLLQCSD